MSSLKLSLSSITRGFLEHVEQHDHHQADDQPQGEILVELVQELILH
jgi:hypothetical protein